VLAFAKSIVETVRHPLVVLNADEHVIATNSAFHCAFASAADEVQGRSFFELNGGLWDTPQLRSLLREVVPNDGEFAGVRSNARFRRTAGARWSSALAA
jgi:two-component system CheB/CheR fusion protein